MNRHRPKWVSRRLLAATGCAAVVWVFSLLFSITRFGDAVTVTVQQGFVGVYWGGDALRRNSGVDNHFAAPWSPGRGAGRPFPKGKTWAFQRSGDVICPTEWARAIRYGTFFNCVLGFWAPDASLRGGTRYVILPTGIGVVAALAVAVDVPWQRRRFRTIGACENCGYNRTGNVSGRCPECGTPLSLDAIGIGRPISSAMRGGERSASGSEYYRPVRARLFGNAGIQGLTHPGYTLASLRDWCRGYQGLAHPGCPGAPGRHFEAGAEVSRGLTHRGALPSRTHSSKGANGSSQGCLPLVRCRPHIRSPKGAARLPSPGGGWCRGV